MYKTVAQLMCLPQAQFFAINIIPKICEEKEQICY